VTPEPLVERVEYARTQTSGVSFDEELELRLEKESVAPVAQVAEVHVDGIDAGRLAKLEEELDVDLGVEAVTEAYALVEPVSFNDRQVNIDESLEVRIEEDPKPAIEVIAQVQQVAFHESAIALATGDETLDIDFEIDKPVSLEPEKQVEPVKYSLVAYNLSDLDELLEISFNIDAEKQDKLMADNAAISSADMVGVTGMPAAGTELFYLRESLSMAADIETSRTDVEIVRIAIENPEDLSYEELLFAASLAPVPEDKLRIYNYAFIHIDRDWRAFNNAAVTAMNMKDFEQAEVYLYQASLISSDNGKVENNMGILACYQNDFVTAENHFLAASQLGVNSEYNLQLIKNLVNNSRNSRN
jgi:hypothetical protein